MHFKSVSGKNLKGFTFSNALERMNILVGDNAAGKTARLDAIRLVCLGCDPALGNKPGLTAQLSSGTAMVAQVTMDTGEVWKRTWDRNGTGCKLTTDGNIPAIPPMLFDAADFFNRTAPERTAYLFSNVPKDKLDFNVCDLTAKIRGIKLDPHGPEAEKVMDDVCEELRNFDETRQQTEERIDLWFPKVVAWIKKLASDAAAVAKQMAGSIQAGARFESADGIGVNAGAIEAELARERAAIEDIAKRREVLSGKATAHRDYIESTKAANDTLKNIQPPGGTLESYDSELATLALDIGALGPSQTTSLKIQWDNLRAEIEAKEGEHKRLMLALTPEPTRPTGNDIDALRTKLAELTKEIESIGQPDVSGLTSQLRDQRFIANEQDGVIKRRNAGLVERKAEMDERLAGKCCPFCEAKNNRWREKIEEEFAGHRTEVEAEIKSATEAMTAACDKVLILAEKLRMAENDSVAVADAKKERTGVELKLATAESHQRNHDDWTRANALFRSRIDALKETTRGLVEKKAALEITIATEQRKDVERNVKLATQETCRAARNELSTALASRKAEEDMLASIKVPDGKLDTILADLKALNESEIVTKENIKNLDLQHRQGIAQRQDAHRYQMAVDELTKKETECDVYRAAAKLIIGYQDEFVGGAIGSVLSKVEKITSGFLGSPLQWRDGDIGRVNDGSWTTIKTFSGMHQRIAFAGLQRAFTDDSPIHLLIVDELGTMSPGNKVKLVERVERLIADGYIDQFIGVDVTARDWPVKEGLQLIEI